MPGFISIVLAAVAMIGVAYTLAAAAVAGRWRDSGGAAAPVPAPSVTLLKPLYGSEPRLEEKLAACLEQGYPGRIEMVCGVSDPADPALDAVRALLPNFPNIAHVDQAERIGSNGKVSNLSSMMRAATGEVLILSDSDMIVPRSYVASVTTALARPGVGAVTLLYAGRGETGGWSGLAAAGISWGFLPNVMVGLATGLAKPCMGSTIAMRRETLDAIGGFARFKDLLADDHAIGVAVRELGLTVAVPPPILLHGCTETSLSAIVAHELRWNATVRMLDPAGYAGAIVTYPLAWGLLATIAGAGWMPLVLALLARLVLAERIDRIVGRRTAPLWWLPARDLLSFGLHVAAFFTRRVDWRGARLTMTDEGRIAAETEILSR